MLWRKTPEDVEVLTLASGVGIRLFRPAGVTGQAPALLWIHGGGYVIGEAAQDDALCRRFARELGATVASVDYRLAPEHPYPVAARGLLLGADLADASCRRSIRHASPSVAPAQAEGLLQHSLC